MCDIFPTSGNFCRQMKMFKTVFIQIARHSDSSPERFVCISKFEKKSDDCKKKRMPIHYAFKELNGVYHI